MNKHKTKFVAIILILGGIYYLFAEFIAIINSLDSLKSYFSHTISDLGVPYQIYSFSRYFSLMKSAFLINGIVFFICYFYLIANQIKQKKVLLTTLSFLASAGVILVGLFHCRCYLISLHFMGTGLTFLCGNLLVIFTGKYSNNKSYKLFCYVLGIIGILSAITILFNVPFKFVPLLERLTIYPIIIFQITTGVIFLKHSNNNLLFKKNG